MWETGRGERGEAVWPREAVFRFLIFLQGATWSHEDSTFLGKKVGDGQGE